MRLFEKKGIERVIVIINVNIDILFEFKKIPININNIIKNIGLMKKGRILFK